MGGGRRLRLVALIAAVVLAVAACATASSPGSSPSKTIRPSDASAASDGPASPVVGIVASVDPTVAPSTSASPAKTPKPVKTAAPTNSPAATTSPSTAPVLGFTMLTTSGRTLTFVIGELDNTADFPPASLYDRLLTEDPIRVYFTVDGNTLVATHIEDAG